MEITEEDLVPPLDFAANQNFYEWKTPKPSTTTDGARFNDDFALLKHKITSSPIVKEIHQLRYSTNKPLKGLDDQFSAEDGNFLTNEMLAEFKSPDPDSFGSQLDDNDMDGFDDDLIRLTTADGDGSAPITPKKTEPAPYIPELEQITIFVHESSITVANEATTTTFQLSSRIRASEVLPGMKLKDDIQDEDTLVLTLESHLLLMIRFFQVDGELKPYVVQWWKTSQYEHHKDRSDRDVGRKILTHTSGKVMALTAAHRQIRLYYCAESPRGTMLKKLYNMPVDDVVLYSCFLDPMDGVPTSSHAMLASLMMTSNRRYVIRLFEWWIDESRVTEHTPLLLPNHFEVPVFVLPFKQSLFMMMEESIILVSVNNILSADYNFVFKEFPGQFPVSYYRSSTPMIADLPENEILIATEDGTIFSIVIYDTIIHMRPILKVPKVDKFTLEKKDDGYHFIFTSTITSGGYIIFEDIIHDGLATDRIPVSIGERITRWDNWAPVWDVEIIETREECEELWMIHGKSISKFKRGLPTWKELNDPSLKSAMRVYHHRVGEDLYFILAFVDKTLVLRMEDDVFVEVYDSGLDLDKSPIHVSSLENVCFQITEDSIVISAFQDDNLVMTKDFDHPLIYADCFENVIVTLMERDDDDNEGNVESVLNVYQAAGEIQQVCEEVIIADIVYFAKLIIYDGSLLVIVGSESRLSFYQKEEATLTHLVDVELEIEAPHDLIAAENVIYITSRTGEYVGYSISGNIPNIVLTKKFSFQLCHSPIDMVMGSDHILLISKNMWKLKFGSKFATPIVFNGQGRHKEIFSAVSLGESNYAVIREDGLSTISVSQKVQPVLKSIKLGVVPRKMKYVPHLGVFAIITENELLFTSKYAKLEDLQYSKKSAELFGNDKPLSLSDWTVPSGQKKFRNILVGCSNNAGGCMKVLHMKCIVEKGAGPVVEVFELHNLKTPGAVLAITQMNDHSILYSSGSDIYSCSYNMTEQKMNDSTQLHSFNSLVTSIDIKGDLVLVSTKDFAITTFTYEDGLLILKEESATERKVTSSLIMADVIPVTTNMLHCLISATVNATTVFKAYPGFVPKLKRCGFAPLWYDSKLSLQRFIAFGLAGDIYLYTLLDKAQKTRLEKYYLGGESILPKGVTKKGLWGLEDGPWFQYRDTNVFEIDRFQKNLPDDVEKLLQSVSI